jgi:hypothetical protein
MRTDRLLSPVQTERQLALPFQVTVAPASLVGPGPVVPARRAWRSLSPTAQAGVRRAILRICREVIGDAGHRR